MGGGLQVEAVARRCGGSGASLSFPKQLLHKMPHIEAFCEETAPPMRRLSPCITRSAFSKAPQRIMPKKDHKDEGLKDEAKGRAKQAAGALSGDDEMKHEGQAEQKKGEAKQKLHDAKEKMKGND